MGWVILLGAWRSFVVEFEWKLTALLTFIPRVQLLEEEKTRMFEEQLYPRYKDFMSVEMRHTFREVIDVDSIAELSCYLEWDIDSEIVPAFSVL